MRNISIDYRKIINFIIILFVFAIVINLFTGEKNIFQFEKNFNEISYLKKRILDIQTKNNKLIFLHNEFQTENRDIQNFFVRKNLNYKDSKEIIIIYD